MAAHTVNLDALIPRDDFVSIATQTGGTPRGTISVSDLEQKRFFQNSLRKPDFQRETTHWSPAAVVDLVQAFLDGDLIPAVILWERGDETFVIDGAHRLSALIAWIRDDYGDGYQSNAAFGSAISDEQRNVADRVRKLIQKDIGTYAEYSGLVGKTVHDPVKAKRLSAIGKQSFVIQWVTAATPGAAEASFFKINQAAQPIDPIERMILQSRMSPNAIASRCIARGGSGHKYWSKFEPAVRAEIENLGSQISDILYKPPQPQPVTSADQPIAGKGYNALLFVYFLVSLCNNLRIPNTLQQKRIDDTLPDDVDGGTTTQFLRNVKSRLELISTKESKSLGLHPLIYFYAKSGTFLQNAFLASLNFAAQLEQNKRLKDFTTVRRKFENYLLKNKVFVTLTISRLGSGVRSLDRLTSLYMKIFEAFHEGLDEQEIYKRLVAQNDFVHLKQVEIPSPNFDAAPSKKGPSKQTKSAAFIEAAMANPMRCPICDGALHSNSITFDHTKRVRDGGNNESENLKPAHPYCNSGFKS